jgi:hypothetical protein
VDGAPAPPAAGVAARPRDRSRKIRCGGTRTRLSIPLTPRFVVTAQILAAGVVGASYAGAATNWAVMTDELQTARLAISIAESFSPVPQVHGEYYAALGQLYPLLLAPLYGLLSAPDAFTAAHVLNPFLLASAAWPAYLLARDITGSTAAGYVAAGLTAFTPWLALGGTLLTENAAYPAFVWSVLLVHRAVVRPTAGRDVAAVGGLLLAFVARTQLFVVALALPAALVAHEVGFAVARSEGSRVRAAREALVRLVASHRVLVGAYASAAVVAAALAARGSLDSVVGNYAETFSSPLLPKGFWSGAAVHLDHVVIAGGVLPFLLALSWASVAIVRPERKEAHAFALLLIVLLVLLTFEAASFDLRFTPGAFVQDRYLCYVGPLLAVGAAAGLAERSHRSLRALLVAGGAVAFAWLAGFASFDGGTVIFWASPASAFHPAIASVADAFGITPTALVRAATLVLGLCLAAALWRVPQRVTLIAFSGVVIGFGTLQALYVLDRHAVPAVTRPAAIVVPSRDWIDALPAGDGSVALVPNPYLGPGVWWDAEFWNERVADAISVDGGPTYTPFPVAEVAIDFGTGAIVGEQPAEMLLLAANETRLRFAERERIRELYPLRVVRVERPYRAEWATRGADADGWMRPGRPVTLRLYPGRRPGQRTVVVTVSAASGGPASSRLTVRVGAGSQTAAVEPGSFRRVTFAICVATAADATLLADGAAELPDGRLVSLHLDGIEARPAGSCA